MSVPAVLASTKHHGTAPYAVPHNVSAIKLELMTNGPSGTQMTVCKRPCSPALIGSAVLQLNASKRSSDGDFGVYKGGVYWTACGLAPPLGKKCQAWGHAVKILGWGHDMVNITTFDNATNSTVHTMCVRSQTRRSFCGLVFPTAANSRVVAGKTRSTGSG